MKKILANLFLVLLLIVPFAVTVSATENTYYLEELGLEITLPEGYKVLTRDPEIMDATLLEMIGVSKEEIIDQFEKDHLYLDAMSEDYLTEITALMTPNDEMDFGEMSDQRLDTLVSEVLYNAMRSAGIEIDSHEIHMHAQAKYAELRYKQDEMAVLQCYTILDGKAINIVMRSFTGDLSDEQVNLMEKVLDDVVYDIFVPTNEQTSTNENSTTGTWTDDNQKSNDLIDIEKIQEELEAEYEAQQIVERRRRDASLVGKVLAGVIVAAVGGTIALIRNKIKEKKANQPVEDEQEWHVDKNWSAKDTHVEKTPNVSKGMYCPNCGQPVAPGSTFCHTCGARVGN